MKALYYITSKYLPEKYQDEEDIKALLLPGGTAGIPVPIYVIREELEDEFKEAAKERNITPIYATSEAIWEAERAHTMDEVVRKLEEDFGLKF